jgi:predicted AAA+ superfamily ATPase
MTRRELLGLGEAGIWTEFFDMPFRDWQTSIEQQSAPRDDWCLEVMRGGYPGPALRLPYPAENEDRGELFEGFVQTYLERDLRDLAMVSSLTDFRRLMRIAALRIGQVINQTEIARDAALPRTTVQRYLDLLEVSYQLVRVEAYAVNRTKRLIKAPKVYWSDTGLALHLSDTRTPSGAHLENLVLTDLLAWRDVQPGRPNILYWRTDTGAEVDFVVEWRGKLLAIEVKAASSPGARDIRHLQTFLTEYGDDALGGLLLHDGEDVSWVADRVLAVPWWKVI